jgi:acetyl/propionyl-CoA carboxylase alpha subunit
VALQIQIDSGPVRDVQLTRKDGPHPSLLQIDGQAYAASLRSLGDAAEVRVDDRTERVWIAVQHDAVFIHAFGEHWRLEVGDSTERRAGGADGADVYAAPMPGTVVSTHVSTGQAITTGEPLLVIESMKLQNEIVAWRDGVVKRTPLGVGDTFDRGAVLVEFEPAGAEAR